MPNSLPNSAAARHRLLPDRADRMAEGSIRKADEAWKTAVGKALERVKGTLSLKEFADAIQRDERQVARWLEGKERPHFDAIFAVEQFRQSLVIALAELAGQGVEIQTVVTIRRSA